MKKSIILFILMLIISVLSIFFFLKNQENPYDFNLKSSFKENTTIEDFKGKKLIVYFGYTFCPDICPATLSLLAKILKDINNDNIHLLFISLDLNRDSNINNTDEWLRYFYPKANALIAKDESTLQKLAKRYNVHYQKIDLKDPIMKYTIAHSNEFFLIDENSKFYKSINDLNPQEMLKEIKDFLNLNP